MATIQSVLGPISTDQLGVTLTHEHVLCASAGIQQVFPEYVNRPQVIEDGVAALATAKAEGLGAFVDLTPMDLGRDIRLLEEVSRRSGVHLIACTGIWRDIPRVFWGESPDTVARLFIREIEEGIEGTGIRAGIIKVANDQEGVTPEGEIILRAAARAQKATGVPISTHSWAPGRVGEQQVRIFREEGVDLDRVCIGHSNDTTDTDYLLGLLRQGVWVGLDRNPGGTMPGTPDWEGRTVTTKKLMDAGYTHRIMVSHDAPITILIAPPEQRALRKERNPDGISFIFRRVIPRLKELGATEADIHRLFVENPRRYFEGGE
ncbi:MAG: phosphotriesterase-related protein [Chloroflexi bacterium]|nr:phosphotriesterase-related protein [Chloroflexota bacterium]